MALVIPSGYALAAWQFTSANGTAPFVTTCGVSVPSSVPADLVDVANSLFTEYANELLPATHTQMTLERVSLQVDTAGGLASYDSDLSSEGGGDSSAPMPYAAAIIMRKITAVGGRAGRGRMFLPGTASENVVDQNGIVDSVQRAALNTAMENLWDQHAVTIPTSNPVLLHDEASPVTAPSTITSFQCSTLVGWIRDRIR